MKAWPLGKKHEAALGPLGRQSLQGKLGPGSTSNRASEAMALGKEVYELYPHVSATLGTLWQLFAYKIPWNVTKCMPTNTGCRGKRGGCGGTLLKWPASVRKLGSKGMEKSLINKMM